ncbi:MAG: hypothetical protein ACO2O0_08550 [Desulfurococcales archaeon]
MSFVDDRAGRMTRRRTIPRSLPMDGHTPDLLQTLREEIKEKLGQP